MSLCDKCVAPGACCLAVTLNDSHGPIVSWDDEDADAAMHARHPHLAMFVSTGPVERYAVADDAAMNAGRGYSSHRWTCTALDRTTGRCTIYERRPKLCQNYEPASDGLCVYYRPLENGEESAL